ncbi:hypothetical protein NMY22_g112 [Coprinellus aureogranulatus]|nr:hypothetical protein NMY22_g112 [Coprinellus aureogranulatus]
MSCSEHSDLEPVAGTFQSRPVLINGKLVANTKRRYHCTFAGCDKAYSKPSRLEEHERSHTGERPFVCETCKKSYLRETHLQAHVRSHLPESSRPLACDHKDCPKRFWTQQHLKAHQDWHNGAKPFACTEDGCNETFAKHHQLRAHVCEAHAPPGTKPYRCDHDGCNKSFGTNQHLRTHKKTHNTRRYTCVQGSCLAGESIFFPNWTALQHHIRTAHPPTCLQPSCNGRVFASQKGLRSHQKLHEQRDAEQQLRSIMLEDETDADEEPTAKKPRRGGELGRDWKCDFEGCDKDFKSKKALTTHRNVNHLGKRDFVCSECSKAFGYKHLLQRHTAKVHTLVPDGVMQDDGESGADDEDDEPTFGGSHIDSITGKAYSDQRKCRPPQKFPCPFPDTEGLESVPTPSLAPHCEHAYSRMYDLRRHLQATHGIEVSKEKLQSWMQKRSSHS